jgi:hypothetical protein
MRCREWHCEKGRERDGERDRVKGSWSSFFKTKNQNEQNNSNGIPTTPMNLNLDQIEIAVKYQLLYIPIILYRFYLHKCAIYNYFYFTELI